MMLSGTVVPFTRLTVVVESWCEKMRCTLVPTPGGVHVPGWPTVMTLHAPAFVLSGATPMTIWNFD